MSDNSSPVNTSPPSSAEKPAPRRVTAAIVLTFGAFAAMVAAFVVVGLRRGDIGSWVPAAAAVALLVGSLLQFADSMYEFAVNPPRDAPRSIQAWWRLLAWFVLVLGSILALVAVWPST